MTLLEKTFLRIPFLTNIPSKGDMKIKINNLKCTEGVLNVTIIKEGQKFNDGLHYREEVYPFNFLKNNTLTIKNLDFGKYAIRVFHDKNCNGLIDAGFLGYSEEAIGFSGEKYSYSNTPDLKDSWIEFSSNGQMIEIDLRS